MNKKLLVLALAGIFSSSVAASDISYDNFTIGWNKADIDVINFDTDGVGAGFSFGINDNWYAKLDTVRTSGDELGVDVDFDFSTINFGYHSEVTSSTDFIAELGYVKAETEVNAGFIGSSADDSGANLVLGFRGMATDNFEWGLNAQYLDLDDSSTFINLEGRYFFTDSFSLGLKGSFESDVNIYALTARFDF